MRTMGKHWKKEELVVFVFFFKRPNTKNKNNIGTHIYIELAGSFSRQLPYKNRKKYACHDTSSIFFFSTNEKVHIIFDHKSDVLWHKGKSNEEKIYCAYLLKKFENEKIKVERGVSLRTKSKKQDLSIDIYHSTRALECGIIEFKKKNLVFWVNSFRLLYR